MAKTKGEERRDNVARRGTYYEGGVCVKCGGTKRLVRNGGCYTCRLIKAKTSQRYQAARAAAAARRAARQAAAREKAEASSAALAAQRAEWAVTRAVRSAAGGCKRRALATGRAFTLGTADFLRLSPFWAGVCPACGVQLTPSINSGPHSPSIDRVHNDRGYTPDNVVILCRSCNSSKHVYNSAQLFRLAEYVRLAEAQADFYEPVA